MISEQISFLRTRLSTVIARVESVAAEHRDLLAQVDPGHRQGAVNLMRYVALRTQDAAALQEGLSALGATSLATPEPAVLERLYAADNVLDAFDGAPPRHPVREIAAAYAQADDLLDTHTDALLGPALDNTHARIMVTLPTEAASDYELVLGFARAGMELARINCAHDGPEVWDRMAAHVARAAEEVGREIRLSCDIAGPKVRTGTISPGPAVVRARVTRDASGELLAPAVLLFHDAALDDAAVAALSRAVAHPAAQRSVAPLRVDADWLAQARVGDVAELVDTRGRERSYTFTEERLVDGARALVAVGDRNAYIAAGTEIFLSPRPGERVAQTTAQGIAPLPQRILLQAGDTLVLSTSTRPAEINPAGPTVIGCTAPEAVAALRRGDRVLFDDGTIAARVLATREIRDPDLPHNQLGAEAVLEVTRAGLGGTKLAAYKGINLPDTDIPLPSLTDEDIEALAWVARNANIAAISFIRSVEDVEHVLATLARIVEECEAEAAAAPDDAALAAQAARARALGLVLKIETIPAYEHLGAIILAGMRYPKLGLMIARGDLAVELGFERMVTVPGRILKMAEAAHIPVIMATQILENLAKTGLPSRAEITDAGYALRAECVMLNKGPHITEAIDILNTMSRTLGRTRLKNRRRLRRVSSWEETLG